MRLIILAQLISSIICQQYQLVGPPARCNEVDMFMPTTQASCYAAAGQMSRGVMDYTGREGSHGQSGPFCAVDARRGDQRVRWNGYGRVSSGWGGNSLGWRAVCVTQAPPPPPPPYSAGVNPTVLGPRPSTSYNGAVGACAATSRILCHSSALCPGGQPFDGGVAGSNDIWVPVSDGIDEWLQYGATSNTGIVVGASNRRCRLHSDAYAPDPHPCHTHPDATSYPDAASCSNSYLYCCSPPPPPPPPTTPPTPPPFDPTLVIAGGAGGAVILLCIIAIAIFICLRKGQSPQPQSANMQGTALGAGAVAQSVSQVSSTTTASPMAVQLKELKELVDMGIITEAEFEAKKQSLLNPMPVVQSMPVAGVAVAAVPTAGQPGKAWINEEELDIV